MEKTFSGKPVLNLDFSPCWIIVHGQILVSAFVDSIFYDEIMMIVCFFNLKICDGYLCVGR